MQQQPELTQRFLMQTSLLPRLSANLCDVTLEIEDSQHILRELEAQNLFLIRLDDQREWYRYHHLFQDMLRYRLQREAPEQIAALHRRASRWFIQHGWLEEGISQAILANDWLTVTQIINQNARDMFSQGKMNTVRRWFLNMPDDIILASDELCINYAWALNLTGGSDDMTPYLRQAGQHLQQASQPGALKGQISLLRGYQSRRHNEFSQSIHYLEKALDLLPQDDIALRATAHIHLGVAHQLQANLKRSLLYFEQAQRLTRHHHPYSFTATFGLQAGVYVALGQLQKAEQICRSMIDEQDSNPGYGYVKMVLSAILLETNRLEESEKILRQTIELGYLSADYTVTIHSLITVARRFQYHMRLAEANTCLQQTQGLMRQTQSHFGSAHYDHTQVRQWILEKNNSAIQQWLTKHPVAGLPTDYQLIFAEGLIAMEQFRQAIRVIESIKVPAKHIEMRIQIQTLLAIAYKQVRDEKRAAQAITLALALAEPAGFQRIFCIFNDSMYQLLKGTLANYTATQSFSVAYIGQLIKMLQGSMQTKQALDDPLTDREITVLRLMAAGLTNRAIAEELVISIGTVKGYSRNIYSKLAVSNRQDAVQSATDLNLI
ncbi:MAG: hypothetical protein GY796_36235 [Chloroflexi bacterium]|nr:hypothetical protein [Chloroflexota bacterium]